MDGRGEEVERRCDDVATAVGLGRLLPLLCARGGRRRSCSNGLDLLLLVSIVVVVVRAERPCLVWVGW